MSVALFVAGIANLLFIVFKVIPIYSTMLLITLGSIMLYNTFICPINVDITIVSLSIAAVVTGMWVLAHPKLLDSSMRDMDL